MISLLNVLFRGLASVSKFLFIVFLARMSGLELSGAFVLMFTIVESVRPFLSYEIGMFTVRENAAHPRALFRNVWNQLFFHLGCIVLLLPLILAILDRFYPDAVSWRLAVLVFFNLLNIQLELVFIGLGHSAWATFTFFFRYSAWQLVLIALAMIRPDLAVSGLDQLAYLWASCEAVVFAGYSAALVLRKRQKAGSYSPMELSREWYRKAAGVISRLFPGAILKELLVNFIVFVVGYFHGASIVSAYSIIYGSFSVIATFVMAGIVNVRLPELLRLAAEDQAALVALLRKMAGQIVGLSVVAGLCVLGMLKPVALYLGKAEILEFITYAPLFMVAVVFLCVSYLFHYYLYVNRRDMEILRLNALTVVAAAPLGVWLISRFGFAGIGWTCLILNFGLAAFGCLAALKVYRSQPCSPA